MNRFRNNSIFLTITIFVVSVYLLFLGVQIYLAWPFELNNNITKAGQLGDSFNIVTSLFSGLAFCALILQLTDAQKSKEGDDLRSNLIAMITNLNTVISEIGVNAVAGSMKHSQGSFGRIYIDELCQYLISALQKKKAESPDADHFLPIGDIIETYLSFYKINRKSISHYYGIVFRILLMIDESKIDKTEKLSYADMLRAFLSDSELILLFYNAISPHGEKFAQLSKKYNIFENIDKSKILDSSVLVHYDLMSTGWK